MLMIDNKLKNITHINLSNAWAKLDRIDYDFQFKKLRHFIQISKKHFFKNKTFFSNFFQTVIRFTLRNENRRRNNHQQKHRSIHLQHQLQRKPEHRNRARLNFDQT